MSIARKVFFVAASFALPIIVLAFLAFGAYLLRAAALPAASAI